MSNWSTVLFGGGKGEIERTIEGTAQFLQGLNPEARVESHLARCVYSYGRYSYGRNSYGLTAVIWNQGSAVLCHVGQSVISGCSCWFHAAG